MGIYGSDFYNLSRLSALIVDDDTNMRAILRMTLEACGFKEIEVANCAPKAFEIIKSVQPDLVITDWEMAGGGGIELVRLVRTNPDSPDHFLPIVLLTGYTHSESVQMARDAGATDFLAKPISAKRVVDRIIHLIEKPRPFVKSEDFFGPCRRRRENSDHDGLNNRVAPPEEMPLPALSFEKPSEGDELSFEDEPAPAGLFRAPNKLKEKLGVKDGPDPGLLIARIEAGIAGLKKTYASWAKADLGALYKALDLARQHLDETGEHVQSMHDVAHSMRAQASTFGYPLITEIGTSLCDLTERAGEFGPEEIEALALHVQAIHSVVERRVEGEGGRDEKEMLAGLRAVAERYASAGGN